MFAFPSSLPSACRRHPHFKFLSDHLADDPTQYIAMRGSRMLAYFPVNNNRTFVEHGNSPRGISVFAENKSMLAFLINCSCICLKVSFESIIVPRYLYLDTRFAVSPLMAKCVNRVGSLLKSTMSSSVSGH